MRLKCVQIATSHCNIESEPYQDFYKDQEKEVKEDISYEDENKSPRYPKIDIIGPMVPEKMVSFVGYQDPKRRNSHESGQSGMSDPRSTLSLGGILLNPSLKLH